MNMRQPNLFVYSTVLAVLLAACRTAPPPGAASAPVPPPELLQSSYLFEVARHLYRWHLDESEVESVVGAKRSEFWVRGLHPELDPGDLSLMGEILMPQLNLSVRVKKADYAIEELGATVKSQDFKIIQVARGHVPARRPSSCVAVEVDFNEMRDYLFRTRNQQDYAGPALLERLREALRKQAAKERVVATNAAGVEQIIHLAPLSPVANETWVFWETGRKLLYFASDIDLANPAVWEHEALMVRIYDLDQQVVVSHEEAPGSNRFLTRDQVGRALFNCLVFGQRMTVMPSAASGSGVTQGANR